MSKEIILDFCTLISKKYNVELNDILECWNPKVKEVNKEIKKDIKKKSTQNSNIEPKLNSFGNYEHKQSGLVFDKDTRKVIGKQVGSIVMKLNESDVEMCHRFSVNFDLNALAIPDTKIPTEYEVEVENVDLEEYDEVENIEEYIE